MMSAEEAKYEELLEKAGVVETLTSEEVEKELDIETDEELLFMAHPDSEVITEGGICV